MDGIGKLVPEAIADFAKGTDLAGPDSITPEILPRPHKLNGLPAGKMAEPAFDLLGCEVGDAMSLLADADGQPGADAERCAAC